MTFLWGTSGYEKLIFYSGYRKYTCNGKSGIVVSLPAALQLVFSHQYTFQNNAGYTSVSQQDHMNDKSLFSGRCQHYLRPNPSINVTPEHNPNILNSSACGRDSGRRVEIAFDCNHQRTNT
jgi:hypothetical protein